MELYVSDMFFHGDNEKQQAYDCCILYLIKRFRLRMIFQKLMLLPLKNMKFAPKMKLRV